jgi:hypothetical protein
MESDKTTVSDEIRAQYKILQRIFDEQRSALLKRGLPGDSLGDYDFLVAQQLVIVSPDTDYDTKLTALKKYEERIQQKPNIIVPEVDYFFKVEILETLGKYVTKINKSSLC